MALSDELFKDGYIEGAKLDAALGK